jgi:hypothetical protein
MPAQILVATTGRRKQAQWELTASPPSCYESSRSGCASSNSFEWIS